MAIMATVVRLKIGNIDRKIIIEGCTYIESPYSMKVSVYDNIKL